MGSAGGGQLQAPAPLQVSEPAHSLAGSCPAGMKEQVPTLPGMTHERQAKVHAVLQHTPSAHELLRHSLPVWQGLPSTFLHVPVAPQTEPEAQAGSGVPAGTGVHIPWLGTTSQDWHVPQAA